MVKHEFALAITIMLAVLVANAGSKGVQYAGSPNHREMAVKAFELAKTAGFQDASMSTGDIQSRLEAGAYSEDYEPIPGTVGAHYPNPWDQGPDFNFAGYYPLSKIPYGSLVDDNRASGWFRGLSHGFDPEQGFRWPGAAGTTIEWANSSGNSLTWDNAVRLYRQGNHAEAYECLGHVLHLLMDLSVPAHVNVVDHGMHLSSKRSGWPIDPDIAVLIVDEYEMALAGGVELSGVGTFIPDLLGIFRNAASTGQVSNIPRLSTWTEYFTSLALITYKDPTVGQYYVPPAAAGQFGQCKNEGGVVVLPSQYGITPPGEIDGRWTQVGLFCTANTNGGSILPEQAMKGICNNLVPKAVEYCAGLILQFVDVANRPAQVELVSPDERDSVRTPEASFVWRKAPGGVDRYWFEISADSLFVNSEIDSTLTDTTTSRNVTDKQDYWWRVRGHNAWGWGAFSDTRRFLAILTDVTDNVRVPLRFALSQNFPNPFNPRTRIRFSIPAAVRRAGDPGIISLKVYDILGRQVAVLINEPMPPGMYEVHFDATDLASGVYLYRLEGGSFAATRKLVILK